MFHIMNNGQSVMNAEAKVLCGLIVRREAITYDRFNKLQNEGRLNEDRCCKKCFKMSGAKRRRPMSEETEAVLESV